MEKMNADLINKVKALFKENKVDLVIGFRAGSRPLSAAPTFIHDEVEADGLVCAPAGDANSTQQP